ASEAVLPATREHTGEELVAVDAPQHGLAQPDAPVFRRYPPRFVIVRHRPRRPRARRPAGGCFQARANRQRPVGRPPARWGGAARATRASTLAGSARLPASPASSIRPR